MCVHCEFVICNSAVALTSSNGKKCVLLFLSINHQMNLLDLLPLLDG